MSEPNTEDRWAALAGNLGVEPAAEAPQSAAPAGEEAAAEPQASAPVPPPPPAFKLAEKTVRHEKKPAKPAAWDVLAGELGIAPMPPPPPVREEPKPAEPSFAPAAHFAKAEEQVEPAEFAAEIEIEAELTRWGGLEPNATEPLSFEPQEALDILDETMFDEDEGHEEGAEAPARPAGEGATPEGDERPGRRRRRRRGRGRGREMGERRESGPRAEADLSSGERAFEASEGTFGEDIEAESPEEGHREEGGDADDDRRGRHRRRGRGFGREQVRDEFDAEEEHAEGESPEFDEGEEDDAIHAGGDFEGEFEGDEDDESGESPRIGFRNIPTWRDAISVMISKNMESRAKNPGGSRGPGGRGRGGRGRGGRGRGRGGDRR
jgi:ribonuclease E